ncbi:cytochrome P450 6A1 [Diachasma alloeum]|uniref:cytochrome P450 6A1 n=1 Tax=Diachasma alloeum TaxID=454923 RepID=UPI0007381CF3|nr:cytochrome P450 6A1 [Diachasma alloeum]
MRNYFLVNVPMDFGFTECLLAVVVLLLLWYQYLIWNYNFWRSRGIPGPQPVALFGTIKDILLGKDGLGSYSTRIYKEYQNEPLVGIYSRREPVLIVRDPDLIKAILIKDFSNFMNRSLEISDKHDPLMQNLFFLDAKIWRPLRTKLTPVFTSGKIREMFYLLKECGQQLDNYLSKVDGTVVEMRGITSKFTTEVIGMCAFGLEANSFGDEESAFLKMGKRIFQVDLKYFFKFILRQFAPFLYSIFGGWLKDSVLEEFFINLARDTIEYREKNNIMRHDFIDLLRNLRKEPSQIGDIELTDELVAAQLTVFFVGGSETSATTISNCLYEMAMNPEMQEKLRGEIREELERSNGQITYEGLNEMKYLDKCLSETLRKYPPVTIMTRKTMGEYMFPGTGVKVPAGVKVWIPVFAIHRDEKYYPEPKVFDPERFAEEEVRGRDGMTFLPFGEGPRNCIGARFGKIQSKYGIVKILQNYTVEVCDKTDKEYRVNSRAMFLTPLNGIYLKINRSVIM